MIIQNIKSAALLFICGVAVSGCITSSPEQLLTPTGSSQPLGQVKNTGDFGNVYAKPEPAAKQLTNAEVARTKSELTREAAPSTTQAKQNNQAIYQREVADLQKLARDQKRRRLKEIEGRSF